MYISLREAGTQEQLALGWEGYPEEHTWQEGLKQACGGMQVIYSMCNFTGERGRVISHDEHRRDLLHRDCTA